MATRISRWVFSLAASPDASFVEMARVAVTSALRVTSMHMTCITPEANINHWFMEWLAARGVTIIRHTPTWQHRLHHAFREHRYSQQFAKLSHLYEHFEMVLGTFLRLDLPLLMQDGGDDDGGFLLYSDVDVLFLRAPVLSDFLRDGERAADYFTVGTEFQCDSDNHVTVSLKTGNAGVMLLNASGMRRTHASFINWVFSDKHLSKGLYWAKLGPVDQGALMAYYAGRGKIRVVPRALFNWKAYWGYHPNASIVHFHGPKPLDYLRFRRTGTARNAGFGHWLARCRMHAEAARDEAQCYGYVATWLAYCREESANCSVGADEEVQSKPPLAGAPRVPCLSTNCNC